MVSYARLPMKSDSDFPGIGDRLLLSTLALGPYVAALIWPEAFWTTHHWLYLPSWAKLIWSLGGLGLAILLSIPLRGRFPARCWVFPLAVAFIYLLLSRAFPIHLDVFGDATFHREQMNRVLPQWDARVLDNLLGISASQAKIGTRTLIGLSQLIALATQGTVLQAMLWLNSLAGAAFAGLWTWWTGRQTGGRFLAWPLWLAGLFAPFAQVFWGHAEVYPLTYLLLLAYVILLTRAWQAPGRFALIGLWVWTLIGVKFHVTSLLLFLPSALVSFRHLRPASPLFTDAKAWLLRLVLPLGLIGLLILALFIYPDHSGRQYTSDTLGDALVLPLFPPEGPPLDRYQLFSGYHLWDYALLVLSWSLPAWLWLGMGKRQLWTAPEGGLLRLLALCLALYATAFFILNPLLSLPLDWDLYSVPAVWLLALAAHLLAQSSWSPRKEAMAAWLGLGAVWLGATVFGVNAYPPALAQRLEAEGRWQFQTYWMGSSTLLEESLSLSPEPSLAHARRLQLLQDLAPLAVPGHDVEYAALLSEGGRYLLEDQQDPGQALPLLLAARTYAPYLRENVYRLFVAHFLRGQYTEAHLLSRDLISVRYPTYQRAYRMAIHVALEADSAQDAETFCAEYLARWPEDAFILSLYQDLKAGIAPDQLKQRFQQGGT